MKPYLVMVDKGITTYFVRVRARSHEEAEREALMRLRIDNIFQVDGITVTPKEAA